MTKQTGTIISIVVTVLVLLCCTGPLCVGGISILTGTGTWTTELGPASESGQIPAAWGAAPCCVSILVLAIPVLAWVLLVGRGQDEGPEEGETAAQ